MKKYPTFVDLVRAVAEHDVEAGIYMLSAMQVLQDFSRSTELQSVCTWEDTTQGHAFWAEMHRKVHGEEL